jgi:O-antigen/teichoic acid export membrane protein
MTKVDRKTTDRRISRDLVWNYLALAVLAASGIAVNIIIAVQYGAAALGVFNQAYAVYVLASQFAVIGIHHSTLKHIAQYSGTGQSCAPIARAAVILSALTGVATAAVIILANDLFALAFDSDQVAEAVLYVAPGLLFFAVNKTNLAVINGLRHMKIFAVCQAARFILIVGFVLCASLYGAPLELLPAAFTFGEVVLSIFLTPYVLIRAGRSNGNLRPWFRVHTAFGMKSALSGFLMEANLRVDVIMIGVFSSDLLVGVYSFAAMLIEGFYNLLVVVRNNVNPLLVVWLRDKRPDLLIDFVRKTRIYLYPLSSLAGCVLVAAYPTALSVISDDPIFQDGWVPLMILVSGIVLYSGTLPFDSILLQMGNPGTHTLFVAAITATNIVLNTLAIPLFGLIGAALATAISMVLGIFYLNLFLKRSTGFRLTERLDQ